MADEKSFLFSHCGGDSTETGEERTDQPKHKVYLTNIENYYNLANWIVAMIGCTSNKSYVSNNLTSLHLPTNVLDNFQEIILTPSPSRNID